MESRTKGLNVVLFGKIKHLSYIIKWKFHVVMIILFFVHDVWTKYLAFSISLSKQKLCIFFLKYMYHNILWCVKKKKNNTISIKCLDPLLYYIPPCFFLLLRFKSLWYCTICVLRYQNKYDYFFLLFLVNAWLISGIFVETQYFILT